MIASSSKLFFFHNGEAFLSSKGGWLLNGSTLINPMTQLYQGDTLCMSWSLEPRWAVGLGRLREGVGVGLSTSLPGRDVPSFLEVDELSLSITLLREPCHHSKLNTLPFLTLRLYN